jgi:hypothetical protein
LMGTSDELEVVDVIELLQDISICCHR